MDQATKEYADAMERGWAKCPKMCKSRFYIGFPNTPESCCGNGHAALGKHGDASQWYTFEKTVKHVMVKKDADTIDLPTAIDFLAIANWTTPQIVEWIRSHKND